MVGSTGITIKKQSVTTDYQRGANLKNVQKNFDLDLAGQYYRFVEPDGDPLEVSGTQCAVYFFDITSIREHVNRVEEY